jgi:hypothetical protein
VHHELTLRALRSFVPSARGADEAVEAHDAQKLLAQVDRNLVSSCAIAPGAWQRHRVGHRATKGIVGATLKQAPITA